MDWGFGLQALLLVVGAVTGVYTLLFIPAVVADRYGDGWAIVAGAAEVAVVVFLLGSLVGGRI